MNSSGHQIELLTLPATELNPRKSKKFALAGLWFSVRSLPEETRCIMCWEKARPGDIFSAW
jgi:hypothetical protein